MQPQVIVLNGISSSGKSSIARLLQGMLGEPYLTFGVDSLLSAMPISGSAPHVTAGIEFGPGGHVSVGPAFRALEAGWYAGPAAIAEAGVGLVLDEVFLGGGASQARLRAALTGLDVLWVAVTCELDVASSREALRADRIVGMAATQSALVHEGVTYDFCVDTTHESAAECAARIAAQVPVLTVGQPTQMTTGEVCAPPHLAAVVTVGAFSLVLDAGLATMGPAPHPKSRNRLRPLRLQRRTRSSARGPARAHERRRPGLASPS